MRDHPPSNEPIDGLIQQQLQARDAHLEPTPFETLWMQAEQEAEKKGSLDRWSASDNKWPIAAAIAAVALIGLIGLPNKDAELLEIVEGGDALFTEITSASAWRAPSDRLTDKYLRLPQWSSPKFPLLKKGSAEMIDTKNLGENS